MQLLNCNHGKACLQANPIQGICPKGWHLPLNFTDLNSAVGSVFWQTDVPSPWKTILSGYSESDGTLKGQGAYSRWWSSTQSDDNRAYLLHTYGSSADPQSNGAKYGGFSVRCVKD
jgi:uncharacterized protein (TIGR02145 family)